MAVDRNKVNNVGKIHRVHELSTKIINRVLISCIIISVILIAVGYV